MTTTLNTDVNLTRHDDIYQMIIDLQEGLDTNQCLKAQAKLILLLANHIGDVAVIRQAVSIAKPEQ